MRFFIKNPCDECLVKPMCNKPILFAGRDRCIKRERYLNYNFGILFKKVKKENNNV